MTLSRPGSQLSDRARSLLLLLAFGAGAILAYGSTLGTFFLADDFVFLRAATGSDRWWWPSDIPGDIVRPLTMLSYRVDALWSLSPVVFRVTNLLLHTANACLVVAVASRLATSRAVGVWSGLLFLLFAGHAEPVIWIGARSDLLMTVWALACLWLYGGVIDRRPRAAARLAGSYAAFAAALLSKESAVVVPILAAGMDVASLARRDSADPNDLRRVVLRLTGFAVVLASYFALRYLLLGVITGEYGGYDVRQSLLHLRMFMLRAMVPMLPWPIELSTRFDLLFYAVLGTVTLALARRQRNAALLLPIVALPVALLPVLPLLISMREPLGERFVYLPSVFGAMWWMIVLAGTGPARSARIAGAALLCSSNLLLLQQSSHHFTDAGSLAAGVVSGFGRHASDGTGADTFVLTVPDTYRGIYVFRTGFVDAFRLFQPGAFAGGHYVSGVAGYSLTRVDQPTTVTRLGPTTFRVDLGDGRIPYPPILPSVFYDVPEQNSAGFTIDFRQTIRRARVLFTSAGTLQTAGVVEGPGLPFGAIDVPTGDITCEGEYAVIAGWAVLATPSGQVAVFRERLARVDGAGTGMIDLGRAEWRFAARPDIAKRFSGLPNAENAAWDYRLPCATLPAGPSVVHVRAIDDRGVEAELGTIRITPASNRP